ncbi:MAG TPA: peptidoglycan editing factor PgeF [Candidatus Acidoferrum sp.]|nr:peptidoglycan editing factor PgeF [Candidatus Acidoferrum sp.]
MTELDDRPVDLSSLVQSRLLRAAGDVFHAFSTRRGGVSPPPFATLNLGQSVGDDPQAVQRNRRRFFGAFGIEPPQVVRVRQVHGDGVLIVDPALAARVAFPQVLLDERYEFDALITDVPDLALVVSTADCLPLLIHDPVRGAAAAVHAGWRSTAKGIAAKAIRAMHEAYGTDPANCRVAIEPGIRGCCFEVDRPVTEAVEGALPTWEAHARPSRAGHWRLDLAGVNRAILQEAGVSPERIEDLGLCTACRTDLFFSHRAENGRTGRMMNLILLRNEGRQG